MIVLLQRSTNQSDDAMAGERLSTLATKCDINQKMIFILPYNDNLMGERMSDFYFKRMKTEICCFSFIMQVSHYVWSQHF